MKEYRRTTGSTLEQLRNNDIHKVDPQIDLLARVFIRSSQLFKPDDILLGVIFEKWIDILTFCHHRYPLITGFEPKTTVICCRQQISPADIPTDAERLILVQGTDPTSMLNMMGRRLEVVMIGSAQGSGLGPNIRWININDPYTVVNMKKLTRFTQYIKDLTGDGTSYHWLLWFVMWLGSCSTVYVEDALMKHITNIYVTFLRKMRRVV
jgi:hypothetical protein